MELSRAETDAVPVQRHGRGGELCHHCHNYPAHFGRLWELEPGAEVYFTDMAGTRTLYIVERQERLRPGDTEALSEPGLTLLTCTREAEAASRCVARRAAQKEAH